MRINNEFESKMRDDRIKEVVKEREFTNIRAAGMHEFVLRLGGYLLRACASIDFLNF
jgi:hypothetical protein